ncbi:MAG: NAD(P)-dependent alcohol dehydrogenase [Hyphomonadaceae bacterium]|nr:NAD(P)-dependent alcohol dehydrogenase [Hyphomonadaceae bacterium]
MMRIAAAVSREATAHPGIEDVDLEAPRPDEVRVRIVAAGICHTDLHCHSGRGMPVPKPIVLGHEGAGVIEEVGAGVTGLARGDHVVISGGSCGVCPSCRSARPTYCRDAMKLAFAGMRADGSSPLSQNGERIAGSFFAQSSFATHVVTPARSAVKVPADLPLHLLGPLGCGIITGAGSVLEALRVRPGQSIVVFGVGSVGLAAIMAARLVGARDVVAVDIDRARLDLATALGATAAIASDEAALGALKEIAPDGFEYSFNTTAAPAVYEMAIACLANEGVAGFVTRPIGEWKANVALLLAGGRKLQGILGGSANPQTFIPLMIDYWRRGLFPFDRLIEPFPFEQIGEAWAACAAGSAIKPVLRMAP